MHDTEHGSNSTDSTVTFVAMDLLAFPTSLTLRASGSPGPGGVPPKSGLLLGPGVSCGSRVFHLAVWRSGGPSLTYTPTNTSHGSGQPPVCKGK